jgi:putative transposase
VSQQLRNAFPYDSAPKYLIHDSDVIFNAEAVNTLKVIGIESVRTSSKSPWQNRIAERFVGCCRRDLLNQVWIFPSTRAYMRDAF